MRTGKMICDEHLALLERPPVVVQERTSEETTDRDGEGESLMQIDLEGGFDCEARMDGVHMYGGFDAHADPNRD